MNLSEEGPSSLGEQDERECGGKKVSVKLQRGETEWRSSEGLVKEEVQNIG